MREKEIDSQRGLREQQEQYERIITAMQKVIEKLNEENVELREDAATFTKDQGAKGQHKRFRRDSRHFHL